MWWPDGRTVTPTPRVAGKAAIYLSAVDGFIDLGTPVWEGIARWLAWRGATKPTATPLQPKPGTRKRWN